MKRAEAGTFAAALVGLSTLAFADGTEGGAMMNHANGWMGSWGGGGMWVWTVVGVLAAVALVVLITRMTRK